MFSEQQTEAAEGPIQGHTVAISWTTNSPVCLGGVCSKRYLYGREKYRLDREISDQK